MSKDDVPYYVGLFAGLIVGTLVLRALGVTGILQALGGLVCGVGFGYVADQACKGTR